MIDISECVLLRGYINGNIGDDLFIRVICNRYKNEKFVIVGARVFASSFRDIENLIYIVDDSLIAKIFEKSANKIGMILGVNNWIYYRNKNRKYYNLCKKAKLNVLISGSWYIEWNNDIHYWEYFFKEEKKYYSANPVVVGVNFGPCKSSFFINGCIELLRSAQFLSVRDRASQEMLKAVEPLYAPDIVFSLDTVGITAEPSKPQKIVISIIVVNEKSATESYIKKMADLINQSINLGYVINLIRFCDYEGDCFVSERIMRLVCVKNSVLECEYNGKNWREIIGLLQSTSMIIAGRFHAMILGWLLNIKTIAICYSPKMVNVINDLFPDTIKYSIQELEQCELSLNYMMDNAQIPKTENVVSMSKDHFVLLDRLLKANAEEIR